MPFQFPNIDVDTLVQELVAYDCLDQLGAGVLIDTMPVAQRGDAEAVCKHFVSAGAITLFQAGCILRGQGDRLRWADYTLLDEVGAGGMGRVYRARHRTMDRVVAIKMLVQPVCSGVSNRDALTRFEQEVRSVARLSHPNIVAAYDCREQDGVPYLVMEYVDGVDLASLGSSSGALTLSEALVCGVQAAEGLAYAHQRGVIHRDVKPANLILDRNGCLKILDLGLARLELSDDDARRVELTATGQVLGTVDYMSPEQAKGAQRATAQSDIYSLGCTLYKLLTGEAPYPADSLVEKILAHRENPVPSVSRFCGQHAERLDSVLRKMMAKRPDDRYESMQAVAGVLAEELNDSGRAEASERLQHRIAELANRKVDHHSTAHFSNIETDVAAFPGATRALETPRIQPRSRIIQTAGSINSSDTITRDLRNAADACAPSSGKRRLLWFAVVAIAVTIAIGLPLAIRSMGRVTATNDAYHTDETLNSTPITDNSSVPDGNAVVHTAQHAQLGENHGSGKVLQLLYRDLPADLAGDSRVSFALSVWVRRDGEFQRIEDGGTVRSGLDAYVIRIEPASAGFLYVIQVDSSGKIAWLFPKNTEFPDWSSGVNPVNPDSHVQIPAGETASALYLDTNTGVEHIYAVLSPKRWPELERAIAAAAAAVDSPAVAINRPFQLGLRGVGGIRPVGGPGAQAASGDQTAKPGTTQPPASHPGQPLVVESWFHHAAATN